MKSTPLVYKEGIYIPARASYNPIVTELRDALVAAAGGCTEVEDAAGYYRARNGNVWADSISIVTAYAEVSTVTAVRAAILRAARSLLEAGEECVLVVQGSGAARLTLE